MGAMRVPIMQDRPSVSPKGLQTGIVGFSQKGTGAKCVDMALTQKLSICFSC